MADIGTGFAEVEGWKSRLKQRKDVDMHFIFGYTREVPVKIKRETSKIALVGLAILIVILFIFLTFEDIDEEIRASDLIFHAPPNSIQIAGADNTFEIDSENLWRSELKNSSRLLRDSQSQ